MTVEELKKQVIQIIKESTETEQEITEKTNLFVDLGLASVEVVVMIGELEETFGIDIPASKLRKVRTVENLCNLIVEIIKSETT